MTTYVIAARDAAGEWYELGEGPDYRALVDRLWALCTVPGAGWSHALCTTRAGLAAALALEGLTTREDHAA